jgi:hypothetical protein
VKGKLEAQDTMDHQDGEVQLESLAPMDQGNREEQARLRPMNLKDR